MGFCLANMSSTPCGTEATKPPHPSFGVNTRPRARDETNWEGRLRTHQGSSTNASSLQERGGSQHGNRQMVYPATEPDLPAASAEGAEMGRLRSTYSLKNLKKKKKGNCKKLRGVCHHGITCLSPASSSDELLTTRGCELGEGLGCRRAGKARHMPALPPNHQRTSDLLARPLLQLDRVPLSAEKGDKPSLI